MKRLLLWLGLAAALCVQAATPVPDLGNARIIVLANNLQNYYCHPNTGRGDYTQAEIEAKTQKIAAMMLESEADIFAFCEVEAKPDVLQHLVDELNTEAGGIYYAALDDGIDEDWDEQYDNNIKSGFVYRIATVQPYGSNYAATNKIYYRNTMRIQAWTEKATGEKFTLSMNHFKAKSDEASQTKRVENATWLVSALISYKVQDPDILVMGDLNCQMSEPAMDVLVDAGFEEQLLRYDTKAYSYVYRSSKELIDHAFANSTMANQVTGAAVWHTNTSESYYNRYSDHDAVLVGLRLGDDEQGIINTNANVDAQKILRDGQLIIIRGGVEYTLTGQPVR